MNGRAIWSVLVVAMLSPLGCGTAFADAGVFTGSGQNLHQISSKKIHLVSIDVTIVAERGPFLFDGGVGGEMDQAAYLCKFVLKSLSDEAEIVQVGFPIDSQFARTDNKTAASPEESEAWVLNYGFIARDAHDTYHVEFVKREAGRGEGEFGSIFTWKMTFAPRETKTLNVSYRIPMSMGLVSTAKDEKGDDTHGFPTDTLDLAMMESLSYVTSTGSSWSGKVESAKFRVITQPFEKYLKKRGVTEEQPEEVPAEDLASNPFVVKHPWWYRKVTPDGGKPVDGGIEWTYQDYKPHDPIVVTYYLTQIPTQPDEVDAFVSRIVDRLNAKGKEVDTLKRAREVLLATYGKEPADKQALAFVQEQNWYEPHKDFSIDKLTESQRAVLARLDTRIDQAEKAK